MANTLVCDIVLDVNAHSHIQLRRNRNSIETKSTMIYAFPEHTVNHNIYFDVNSYDTLELLC